MNKLISHIEKIMVIAGEAYTFVRDVTPKESKVLGRVGIFKDRNNESVILKKHPMKGSLSGRRYIRNESHILSLLSKKKIQAGIHIPKWIAFENIDQSFVLAMSYLQGKPLFEVSESLYTSTLSRVYTYLDSVELGLTEKEKKQIPARSRIKMFGKVLAYTILNIFTNPHSSKIYISMCLRTCQLFFKLLGHKRKYVLTHGGLYLDSILYEAKTNSIAIIDWENAQLADAMTDPAQTNIFFYSKIDRLQRNEIVQSRCKSMDDKVAFELESLYKIIELGNEVSSFIPQNQMISFLNEIRFSEVVHSKSPYELVHGFTFKILSIVLTFFPRQHSRGGNCILCYHSVSNSGWRYSTPVDIFSNHIDSLRENWNIVPLKDIVDGIAPAGSVAITFDDAYSDVFENAFPILQKHGLVATVFALGDPAHARRDELDTQLPFMSFTELQQLHKAGWGIGYHTQTHPDLHACSKHEAEYEIRDSKVVFEQNLGFPVSYFAYPKGKYSDQILGIVESSGYEAAFTVDSGVLSRKNKFAITRLPTEGVCSPDELDASMTDIGLRITALYMKILQVKEKIGKM